MADQTKVYVRGTICTTPEDAISRGLYLTNGTRRFGNIGMGITQRPPGVFFEITDGSKESGIDWAVNQAKKLHQQPCLIQIEITPTNFYAINGKIWEVISEFGGAFRHDYELVADFRSLPNSQVAIAMEQLTHEDLIALNTEVGFIRSVGEFEYHPYEFWCQTLGVHAETREERTQRENK